MRNVPLSYLGNSRGPGQLVLDYRDPFDFPVGACGRRRAGLSSNHDRATATLISEPCPLTLSQIYKYALVLIQ